MSDFNFAKINQNMLETHKFVKLIPDKNAWPGPTYRCQDCNIYLYIINNNVPYVESKYVQKECSEVTIKNIIN